VAFKAIDGDAVVEMSESAEEDPDTERIYSFCRADAIGPTASAIRDYDWTNSDAEQKAENLGVTDPQGRQRAFYMSTAETTIGGYSDDTTVYTEHDIVARARLLQERIHGDDVTFVGEGLVTGFMPGHKIKLGGHEIDTFNDHEYVLTSDGHAGEFRVASYVAERILGDLCDLLATPDAVDAAVDAEAEAQAVTEEAP